MSETREIRLKRLYMRATHRGTKEMDIIFGKWAELRLSAADDAILDIFEALLEENDQDLYLWASAQAEAPQEFKGIMADIRMIVGTHKDFERN